MRDGIVAAIQIPLAGLGFDSNRSGIGIKRRKTAARYDVAVRTVERWDLQGQAIREAATTDAEAALGFPPSRLINGKRYDNDEWLDAWDTAYAAAGRATRMPPAAGKPTDNRKVKAGGRSRPAAAAKSAQPAEITT
jgi:hypothetical protein